MRNKSENTILKAIYERFVYLIKKSRKKHLLKYVKYEWLSILDGQHDYDERFRIINIYNTFNSLDYNPVYYIYLVENCLIFSYDSSELNIDFCDIRHPEFQISLHNPKFNLDIILSELIKLIEVWDKENKYKALAHKHACEIQRLLTK